MIGQSGRNSKVKKRLSGPGRKWGADAFLPLQELHPGTCHPGDDRRVTFSSADCVASHTIMLCPDGTGGRHGAPHGLSPLHLRYPTWEDRVWPTSGQSCGLRVDWRCRARSLSSGECIASDDAAWRRAKGNHPTLPQLANRACVVVPSARLLFSMVWKTGTRTLLSFLKCAFGKERVHHFTFEVVGAANASSPCERVPPDYLHVAGVREPFARFLSGYREFLRRSHTPHPPGLVRSTVSIPDASRYAAAQSAEARFAMFVHESRCRTYDAWAHVASQSWFVRKRRVDIFLRTERLSTDLVAAFGAPHCVPTARANAHSSESAAMLSEARYYAMLRSDARGVRTTLCAMMAQDIACLFCGRAAIDCGRGLSRTASLAAGVPVPLASALGGHPGACTSVANRTITRVRGGTRLG